jgi:hypothetical protein
LNNDILNTVSQEFINNNLNSDITSLILKKNQKGTVDIKLLTEQIEAKKRCKKKLPTWFNAEKIYYPNKLNIEQTSSEITAKYKSELVSGKSILDLTGGFGVDCYYFSNYIEEVSHCEINEELSEIVKHNYQILHKKNIDCIASDGIKYLQDTDHSYDWIYLDPSRRHDSKGKVFFLKDCLPSAPQNLELLFDHSKNVLVKTSPLLDITVGINELRYVKTIHVVAVNNEVKELLWILEKGYVEPIIIVAVNIKSNKTETFNFLLSEEIESEVSFGEPLTYLYEPNAAILKSGAFKSVSSRLNVLKLHPNTHLYTLNKLIDFPGRRFKIEKILPYSKKLLKKEFIYKANVSSRNFPESVDQIKRKLNVKDGGNVFLFVTTSITKNRVIIICSKID